MPITRGANHLSARYTVTYVDFTDAGFTVVDDDSFEVGLKGWTQTIESGMGMDLDRTTERSRTGVGSMRH